MTGQKPEPLLPDNWSALAPLVDVVLDAPVEKREALLDTLSAGDATKRAALSRLVDDCERDAPLLDRQAAERFDQLLDDAPEVPLPEMLGGRYRIERELGRGGMARVYLARDEKHARHVAVKVIRPEFAASLGRDRFLREIRIAAQLHHPNIVALYDSGDADGVLYFVMPYEEGPCLRTRLAEGTTLTVAECVGILHDVARALAYAHERGVVHRDIKPDNVMLSGGAAIVADFGIAKAVSVAQGDTVAATLTQAGAGLGTASYMAPEQAVGDPSTDHRADIYSFGCVAYELFAGHPPFHDLPTHQIIAAHVGTTPVPIGQLRSDIPDAVNTLITKCLEKNPAARPQSAHELLAALESHAIHAQPRARRQRISGSAIAALALVLAVVVAGAWYRDYAKGKRALALKSNELTIAVLPMRSLGGDSLQSDMAGGLSDEVAARMRVPGVRTVSRSGASKYSGLRNFDAMEVARALGARFLVWGTYRDNNGRVNVTAQLFDSTDAAILWATTFERTDGDLSAIRDGIVQAVTDTIGAKFTSAVKGSPQALPQARSVSNEAYANYILAQSAFHKRGTKVRPSVDLFKKAIALDSSYADAWAGLSLALALTPYFHPTSTSAVAQEATSAARKALSLDSTLALPHAALGNVYQHDHEWERAEIEFKSAIRLNTPGDAEPLIQYSRHLLQRTRLAESLAQLVAAQRIEPASAIVASHMAYTYYLMKQYDSAVVVSKRAFQLDSANLTTLSLGAFIRLSVGDTAGARHLIQLVKLPNSAHTLYVLAATGDSAVAMKRLRALETIKPRPWMTELSRVVIMLAVGDTAAALDALERSTAAGEMWTANRPMPDPVYDPIRGSARFREILRQVRLPLDFKPAVAVK